MNFSKYRVTNNNKTLVLANSEQGSVTLDSHTSYKHAQHTTLMSSINLSVNWSVLTATWLNKKNNWKPTLQ